MILVFLGSTPGAQDTVTTPDSDNDEATDSTTTTTSKFAFELSVVMLSKLIFFLMRSEYQP